MNQKDNSRDTVSVLPTILMYTTSVYFNLHLWILALLNRMKLELCDIRHILTTDCSYRITKEQLLRFLKRLSGVNELSNPSKYFLSTYNRI